MHGARKNFLLLAVLVSVFVFVTRAEVGGKITGVIKDQTGSVIVGAAVVVTNTQTGIKLTATTDQDGVFTFPVLSVGQYQIDVTSDGFRSYRSTGLVIDINSALVVDVTLQVKEQDQSITITENAAQVETTDTQLGQVLGTKKVTEIPLNGRTYTDLFALQVGVTPITTSGAGNSTSGGGFGTSLLPALQIPASSRSTASARMPMGFPSTAPMCRKASASKPGSFRTSILLPSFVS
jgi:hypothetical protein